MRFNKRVMRLRIGNKRKSAYFELKFKLFMMRRILFLVLLLPCLAFGQTQSGIVFEDSNGNGKKDRKEKGIAGVAVSNGVDVVVTDESGRYTLPLGDDQIFFVIKPADYRIPVDSLHLPRYYRIHKPNGSPSGFQYTGVAPTPALPASLDFGLVPEQENRDFSALIFGDPQPYTLQDIEWFTRGVVRDVTAVKDVAFGLSLGDLVGDNLTLHQPYIRAVKELGLPWYNLMGNHDMNYEATADHLSDETFEANFGPANYAFNYGNAHFIILDDILYPDPRDGKGYWGGFRPDQLDFVENNLKFVPKDKLIVLAFHIPLFEEGDSFRDEDRQRLFDHLKEYPNVFSMSAHTHLQRQNFFGANEGWHGAKPWHEYNAGTTSGDWYSGEMDKRGVPYSTMRDGTERGYAFLRIRGNTYSIDYKVAGESAAYQMEIFSPKVIPHGRGTTASIYVNFFMGREGDKVEYRIDNGEWKPMRHVQEQDPSYQHRLHRWDYADTLMAGRRPSNAVISTHLWRAGFPANLEAGEHHIEVRAEDMFGKVSVQRKNFRVEK